VRSAIWLLLGIVVLALLLAMYQQPRFIMAFADLITACF